ncbi:hypothetical protein PsorP6_019288 [Peronosclerospora sorghi]|nr:hypothetical protein PsorP6_019288 [Peronosclerospora sorghi]
MTLRTIFPRNRKSWTSSRRL